VYVESELDRTIRKTYPGLGVRFAPDGRDPGPTPRTRLCWIIAKPQMDKHELFIAREYIIEARLPTQNS
jgi:hypothetical protein